MSKTPTTLIIMDGFGLTDVEKGMGSYRAVLDEDAADFLSDVANGDARAALNALELGVLYLAILIFLLGLNTKERSLIIERVKKIY